MTMQPISVFDVLKIGVGPSSSHTTGPWLAAHRFLQELPAEVRSSVVRVEVDLFGSLAKTGKGHGTDIGVQLGLSGKMPETIDVATIDECIGQIANSKKICLLGAFEIPFEPDSDIRFLADQQLPFHPNAIRFVATMMDGTEQEAVFYSIGGGFIVKEHESVGSAFTELPYPIETAHDLLDHCTLHDCRIAEIVMQNELCWRGEIEVRDQLMRIREAMFDSIWRGCHITGVLPGGLRVQRRASGMARKLLKGPWPTDRKEWIQKIRRQPHDFSRVLDWVSCFALAVNEENAAFGRVVTAPTNGAAGVIPAVLLYCESFCDVPEARDDFETGKASLLPSRRRDQPRLGRSLALPNLGLETASTHVSFLLTAGVIGCIFKQCATISAALGGCQAEIGVASAMAAAALTESLGGTPAQSLVAAEIAMEHHLGLTCDPIGGLVQIPCIERNAMGAVKAITAAQMALQRDPHEARVSLDTVIRTMWETAQDMNAKYKETSEGGLAVQIAVNVSEC